MATSCGGRGLHTKEWASTLRVSVIFCLIVCAIHARADSPSIAEIAAGYTKYRLLTEGEILVNPEFAMLCVGVSRENVEKARIQQGPHANTSILIYMNEPAARAFGKSETPFPVGAVIVKRKRFGGYRDEKGHDIVEEDTGVGGMVKRPPGFDPGHGDWEYFYFEGTGEPQSGRITSCVQCHESVKSKDYVFGSWATSQAGTLR